MTDQELPPLPKPTDYGRGLYTAEQMREYGRAAVTDALREAAQQALKALEQNETTVPY